MSSDTADHHEFHHETVLTINLQLISQYRHWIYSERPFLIASSRVVADVGPVRLITKFDNSGRQLGTDHHQDLMRMVVSTLLVDDLQGCSGFHGLMHSC